MFRSDYSFQLSKFFLYLVPFTVVIVYGGTLFPFIVGKYVFFRTVVELALLFFIWGWALAPTARPATYNQRPTTKVVSRKSLVNPLTIAVAVFVFVYLLAGFTGIDPAASFWSNFERGEGGLQLLHLLAFFILLVLLFRDGKDWRRLFIVSLIAALLLIGYGVFGAVKYIDASVDAAGNVVGCNGPWCETFRDFIGSDLCTRLSGSLGNPAYVGTYMIFVLFYGAMLFVYDWARRLRWLWFSMLILFGVVLLLTQTRGAFLGLGMGVIATLLYLLFAPLPRTVRLTVFAILAALVLGGSYIVYSVNKFTLPVPLPKVNIERINALPFCEGKDRKSQVLDIRVDAQTFKTRLVLWRQSIEAFKERPLLGWGPENFSIAIERHFDPALSASWFDRAHSIFFDYLIFGGIAGLLSLLGVFAAYYWEFFQGTRNNADVAAARNDTDNRRKKGQLPITNYQLLISRALLFGLPVAYLVQGAVLFDVLPTYLNLFLILAFANWILRRD